MRYIGYLLITGIIIFLIIISIIFFSKFKPSAKDVYNKTYKSIVPLYLFDKGLIGTAFIYGKTDDDNLLLITSAHTVLENEGKLLDSLYLSGIQGLIREANIKNEGVQTVQQELFLVGVDAPADVALLTTNTGNFAKANSLSFSKNGSYKFGTECYIIGSPNDLVDPQITGGIVRDPSVLPSPLNEAMTTEAPSLMTDASTSTGGSGSPILNSNGEVIAMAQWILSDDSTFVGGINQSFLQPIIEKLIDLQLNSTSLSQASKFTQRLDFTGTNGKGLLGSISESAVSGEQLLRLNKYPEFVSSEYYKPTGFIILQLIDVFLDGKLVGFKGAGLKEEDIILSFDGELFSIGDNNLKWLLKDYFRTGNTQIKVTYIRPSNISIGEQETILQIGEFPPEREKVGDDDRYVLITNNTDCILNSKPEKCSSGPNTGYGNSLAFSNSIIVAAGDGVKYGLYYSDNGGESFQPVREEIERKISVSYNDTTKRWVAVGNYIHWSDDGINWNKVQNIPQNWVGNHVTYGDNKWLAVGSNGSFYSMDGVTWTKTDETDLITGYYASYSDSKWVMVGSAKDNNPRVYYSTDAINWLPAIGDPFFYGEGNIVKVNSSGNWVAVGKKGGVWYSSDGESWQKSDSNIVENAIFYGLDYNTKHDRWMTYYTDQNNSNYGFVYSTNAAGSEFAVGTKPSGNVQIKNIHYGNAMSGNEMAVAIGRIIIDNNNYSFFRSIDGINWELEKNITFYEGINIINIIAPDSDYNFRWIATGKGDLGNNIYWAKNINLVWNESTGKPFNNGSKIEYSIAYRKGGYKKLVYQTDNNGSTLTEISTDVEDTRTDACTLPTYPSNTSSDICR